VVKGFSASDTDAQSLETPSTGASDVYARRISTSPIPPKQTAAAPVS
jgi:hypothetical protein